MGYIKKKDFIALYGEEAWNAKAEKKREYMKQYKDANKERLTEYSKQYREANKERIAERQKQYKDANKERLAEYSKQYYQDNKEHSAEYRKQYYQEKKEHLVKQAKQYYQENKERILNQKKQYRENNKEHIAERQKQYKDANKEHLAEYNKQYREDNKEHLAERMKQWRQDNKEHIAEYRKQYKGTQWGRANNIKSAYISIDKKKGISTDQVVDEDWIVENIFNSSCVYCGDSNWTHLGADRIDNTKGHTPDNCVCACGVCNIDRGDKFSVEEFKEYRKTHPRKLGGGIEKSWEIVEKNGVRVIKKKNVYLR